jgi:uncharacterized protein YlxW (UPF0749 family)
MMAGMRRRSSLLLASVVALLGFLLVTAASTARENRRAEEPRKAELIHQIVDRRTKVDDLDKQIRQLREQVTAAQRQAAARSTRERDDAARAAILAEQAGTVAMRGPALTVRLSDSDRKPTSPNDDAGALKIHDSDLQLVVNALFASGAEAIAVNDNRVVATTPIRAAGDTIVVNFRPLVPPYRVVAIGAGQSQFEQSEIAKRFRRWTKLFGLGFSVSRSQRATVPAYIGQTRIDDAAAVKAA